MMRLNGSHPWVINTLCGFSSLNPKQASWLMTTHMFPFLLVAFCTCRESYDLASPNWKELQRWENNYIVIMESRHMCLTWRSATAWKTRDAVSPTYQTILKFTLMWCCWWWTISCQFITRDPNSYQPINEIN